jgi:exonuclease III
MNITIYYKKEKKMEKTQHYKLKIFTDIAEYLKQEKRVPFELTLPCGKVHIGEYHYNNKSPEIDWEENSEPCLGENQKEMIEQIKKEIRSVISTYNLETKN